jgi:hypothetical protein
MHRVLADAELHLQFKFFRKNTSFSLSIALLKSSLK